MAATRRHTRGLQRKPFRRLGQGFLPLGNLFTKFAPSLGHGSLGGGNLVGPLLFSLLAGRPQRFGQLRKGLLSRGNRCLLLGFEFRLADCPRLFLRGEGLYQSCVIVTDRIERNLEGIDFCSCWQAVENSHKEFLNQRRIAGDRLHEFVELIALTRNRRAYRWPAHQGHDRAQLQVARSLALACRFPHRPPQIGEETIRSGHTHVRKGCCSRPGGHPWDLRRGTGHAMDRVVEHLCGQSPRLGVAVVERIVGIPLVGFHGKLIRAARANRTQHMTDIKPTLQKLRGEMVQEGRIRRRVAGTDVVDRLNQPNTEQIPPETIHVASRKVAVVWRGDPGCQLLTLAGRL